MTEARRLLERLTTDEAMSYPVDHGNPGDEVKVSGQLHCDYCDANVDSDGPHNDGCPWADARAYLAQPMTTCEETLDAWKQEFGGLDSLEVGKMLQDAEAEARMAVQDLAESRAREGELVAALRAELVELVDGNDSTLAEQVRDLILNLDDGTLAQDAAALAQGKKD